MSASILWQPLGTKKQIHCSSPSDFISSMNKIFPGNGIWILTKEEIPILTGMSAVESQGKSNIYDELIRLIETMGPIEVSYEY